MITTLIVLLVVIAIAAVILWGMEQLPMDATLKNLMRVVIIVFLSIWLLIQLLHLVGGSL